MRSLKEIINDAEKRKVAVGHFNIANIETLKAISEAALELKVPIIIGASEGEREFLDTHNLVSLVGDLRENHGLEVFLNADHTHSFEKAKEAVDAGYDAVLFDGGKLSFDENIEKTKQVVGYARSVNKEILIEGELGYIGGSSKILKEIPEGAAIKEADLTTVKQAEEFVEKTGVDFLAPAVGNLHGMFKNAPNPRLNINRIREIKARIKIPLVLHGGSGIVDEDFISAIEAGITIIHISTEIRSAWRRGLEAGFKKDPEEVAPYKLVSEALDEIKTVVYNRLKLFNKL